MSRLRANTSFASTAFNNILMEFAPNNRVLSGELIVFQNEMLEIFKEMITRSNNPMQVPAANKSGNENHKPVLSFPDSGHKVKPRFIISVVLEFLRTLLENQIPQ